MTADSGTTNPTPLTRTASAHSAGASAEAGATAMVGGAHIHYTDIGAADAPAVVFSHGNLMDASMWAPQLAHLSGYRRIAWDARLHGHTRDDGLPYTYWRSARDLLGLLDHLGIERATLIGHSQGGFVALRAALLAPHRIAGLVLIDTMHTAWPAPALEQMGQVRDLFAAAGGEAVAPILLPLLLARPEHHPHWGARWGTHSRERHAAAVHVLMGVDDLSARIAQITAPALVIHGEHDQPVPLPAAQALAAALPGAREPIVIPGAGHTPSLTHPHPVNLALAAFLAELPAGPEVLQSRGGVGGLA